MSSSEIDAYLAKLDEPKRRTLEQVRRTILAHVPHAEQGLSYGAPVFKVNGKAVAGFAAYRNHLSYLPHSGSVLSQLADDLDGYDFSKGALKFPVDTPLAASLIRKLIAARMKELGLPGDDSGT